MNDRMDTSSDFVFPGGRGSRRAGNHLRRCGSVRRGGSSTRASPSQDCQSKSIVGWLSEAVQDTRRPRRANVHNELSRRDALTRLAGVAGVGALAGASPSLVWAQEKETQEAAEPHDGQAVGTARLTPEVRAAVKRGLEFLAKPGQQAKDGSWPGLYPVGFTSLALMAFMLEGNVPGRGRYGNSMEGAVAYLVAKGRTQRGVMANLATPQIMYEHGLAVLALSEAWGQSRNSRIRTALRRGVDVILRSQNETGGWRYKPDSRDADLSITTMQFIALLSAKEAGIVVPQTTMVRAEKYILGMQNKENGRFGYVTAAEGGIAMTAAAVTSLMLYGKGQLPAARRGLAALKAELASAEMKLGGHFFYSNYYSVQAMYQAGDAEFQAWYPKISSFLLSSQKSDGSWHQRQQQGPAYCTAMAILILGVPYRFLPIYQR